MLTINFTEAERASLLELIGRAQINGREAQAVYALQYKISSAQETKEEPKTVLGKERKEEIKHPA